MSFNYYLPEITSLQNPDQLYLQQIKKLEREIKAIKCSDENGYYKIVYSLFKKFAENYLMPPEYWKVFHCIILRYSFYSDLDLIQSLSVYHCYHITDYYRLGKVLSFEDEKIISNPRRKFMQIFNEENEKNDRRNDGKKSVSSLIKGLQYPNCDINDIWALYEYELCMFTIIFKMKVASILGTFPPKNIIETYQKMRSLHLKIKSLENDKIFEWFNTLLEVGDDEFVIQNVEYRLGKDLTNKMLWKLYIKFWDKRDKKMMLQIYSKFCRIFIGQKSIKAEYEKEVKKYGPPLSVPWTNPFRFEKYDSNFDFNFYQKPAISKKQQQNHIKPITCYFTSENAMPQSFPFRQTFIKYIFDNASPTIKQKLQNSCKYFFIQNSTLICYKFIVQKVHDKNLPVIDFYQHTVTVDPSYLAKANFGKIYISTVFEFIDIDNPLSLSTFIPKIVKCNAKFVKIYCQKLTIGELKVIIGDGNVKDILLSNVQVIDESGDVGIEDILKLTPKIKKIRLPSHPITTTFFSSLINIPFANKFELIDSQNVRGEDFDPKVFVEFLIAKVSPKCKINFFFKFSPGHTLDQMYDIVSTHNIKDTIHHHFGKDEAPEYRCNYTIG